MMHKYWIVVNWIFSQCSKLLLVRQPEAGGFGGGPGTFYKIFLNFMFIIWDSRQQDWQHFWLSLNTTSVTYKPKYNKLHTGKLLWKCCLQSNGHFVCPHFMEPSHLEIEPLAPEYICHINVILKPEQYGKLYIEVIKCILKLTWYYFLFCLKIHLDFFPMVHSPNQW